MPRELLRLFATGNEVALLGDQADGDILRLWTIKEAIFKACPRNAGLQLADFEVQEISTDGFGRAVLLFQLNALRDFLLSPRSRMA